MLRCKQVKWGKAHSLRMVVYDDKVTWSDFMIIIRIVCFALNSLVPNRPVCIYIDQK